MDYLYDGVSLVEEVDNGGNLIARYTSTRNLDEQLAQFRSSTTSYYQCLITSQPRMYGY